MMRHLLLIFWLCGASISALWAQTPTSTPAAGAPPRAEIKLAVLLPKAHPELTDVQIKRIEAKLTQGITQAGFGTSPAQGSFVVYPVWSSGEDNVVEGLTLQHVISSELSLFVKHADVRTIFASTSITLNGSGKTKEAALNNAIASLRPGAENMKKFFETARAKIVSYYNGNCANLLRQATAAHGMQQYDKAISLLADIPADVTCFDEVQPALAKSFIAYQNQTCTKKLQEAKALAAGLKWDASLEVLMTIDPQSKCAPETQKLIAEVGKKVSADYKQRYSDYVSLTRDQIKLRTQQAGAIQTIATSYLLTNRPAARYEVITGEQ